MKWYAVFTLVCGLNQRYQWYLQLCGLDCLKLVADQIHSCEKDQMDVCNHLWAFIFIVILFNKSPDKPFCQATTSTMYFSLWRSMTAEAYGKAIIFACNPIDSSWSELQRDPVIEIVECLEKTRLYIKYYWAPDCASFTVYALKSSWEAVNGDYLRNCSVSLFNCCVVCISFGEKTLLVCGSNCLWMFFLYISFPPTFNWIRISSLDIF